MERGSPGAHKKGECWSPRNGDRDGRCPRQNGDPSKKWPGLTKNVHQRGTSIPEEPPRTEHHSAWDYGYPGNEARGGAAPEGAPRRNGSGALGRSDLSAPAAWKRWRVLRGGGCPSAWAVFWRGRRRPQARWSRGSRAGPTLCCVGRTWVSGCWRNGRAEGTWEGGLCNCSRALPVPLRARLVPDRLSLCAGCIE